MLIFFRSFFLFVFQPALDLLSRSEMELLLTGSAGCGPPSALQLQRFATYESPLSADDPHVLVRELIFLDSRMILSVQILLFK